MQLVPTPWYLIPDSDDVLGPAGHPVPAHTMRPADRWSTEPLQLRCVYSDEEIMTRALIVLVEHLGGRIEPV